MTLEQDIQSAIEKQLPGEVGTILKQRLEQAEKDAASVLDLREKLEASNTEGQRRGAELAKHDSIDARLVALGLVETELKEREIRQELNDLRVTLSTERLTDMKQLVQAVLPTTATSITRRRTRLTQWLLRLRGCIQRSRRRLGANPSRRRVERDDDTGT